MDAASRKQDQTCSDGSLKLCKRKTRLLNPTQFCSWDWIDNPIYLTPSRSCSLTMDPFRHDSFLAPGFSHHYDPKTSAVLAELRESFTEMDEEDWDLHRKRQFTRQRHEDKRKFLVPLRIWMDDKLAVSTTSEEDDNQPDYRYTGCAPVTHDKVASQEDNRRSVCGSFGCAPVTMDSKHSSEDNSAHSHCVFLGCAPLTICEQAVPPTMGAGFYGEPVYPSAEVMHAGVIYFQTVSTHASGWKTCWLTVFVHFSVVSLFAKNSYGRKRLCHASSANR
ncbi:hypothetical protein CLF_104046 [Clonorchis sinensis]|uniref:Uncharacterized protein n=1 Tax=Clonorchis sinensis TaxID=79923 RepID=G7YAU2_CLOSI|nr:hypothetical protein CLF_104046 [Clonorchis sinensis]